jgi:putative transposase
MKGVEIPGKRHSPEQILHRLREVEVALSHGETVARAVRQIAVTEQTYYPWRNEYGGLSIDQARKLKKLELDNARLKRAVADLTLDKLIPKEAPEGNFRALLVAASVWSTFDRYWMFLNAKPAEFSDSQEQPSVLSVSAPRYHIRYHTLIRFHGVLRGVKEHREGIKPSRC